jgi:hypothetical protein
MRKTVITLAGAAVLGLLGSTMTPAPASAFPFIFFAPAMAAKEDKSFKAVNPYAPTKAKKAKKKKM